jgi:ElaB/YqjD/DUF883 family membrane-anchored ribosome-binding protein
MKTNEKLLTDLHVVATDAEDLLKATHAQVKRHPWMAVGVAAGLALVLGVVLGRR